MDYTKYCITERQREICQAYQDCKFDLSKTAIFLGMDKNIVKSVIYRIKKKAEKNTKEYPIDSDNADSIVKSTSTLYDKDGAVITKWVKSDTSKNQLKKLIKLYIDEYSEELPRFSPVKITKKDKKFEEKLIVYPLADLHLGMLSWANETNNNYNSKIANETIRKFVTDLIDKSPACEECLICNLGDFLHVDNLFNKTPKNENILDVDSRYAKILNVAVKLMRYVIEYSLLKHKHITVVNCIGNHDPIGSLWLNTALQHIYEKEKRITIKDNSAQRQYFNYGNNLFGMCHGQEIKDKDFPLLMATEEKELWGKTDFHYWLLGHWHHNKVVDVCGCSVEAFSPLCAKDAYAVSKGFNSNSKMQFITYDKHNGEETRYSIYIRY